MSEIKPIIERILRLKEEQDAISDDVRDVYAEAKSNGFDKTALGQVVAIIRKRAKHGAAKIEEQNTVVETYLAAFDGGTQNATRAHAHENHIPPVASAAGRAAPERAAASSPAIDLTLPACLDRRVTA